MANSKRKYKSTKITKSAEGEECQVRIPGVCNFNSYTTIFAHLNGGGMGMKRKSIFGAYCCSSCHDAVDFRVKVPVSRNELIIAHYEGVIRTQEILLGKGLILEK
jgi:hypothetical protein